MGMDRQGMRYGGHPFRQNSQIMLLDQRVGWRVTFPPISVPIFIAAPQAGWLHSTDYLCESRGAP